MKPRAAHPRRLRRSRAFTLVEVLATTLLVAIVLPAIMKGMFLADSAGNTAHRRTEAAGLAESKLAQIVADGTWQSGNVTGDFGQEWPAYKWSLLVQPWAQDTTTAALEQVDLQVTWTGPAGRDDSITLTTLAYVRPQQQQQQ